MWQLEKLLLLFLTWGFWGGFSPQEGAGPCGCKRVSPAASSMRQFAGSSTGACSCWAELMGGTPRDACRFIPIEALPQGSRTKEGRVEEKAKEPKVTKERAEQIPTGGVAGAAVGVGLRRRARETGRGIYVCIIIHTL